MHSVVRRSWPTLLLVALSLLVPLQACSGGQPGGDGTGGGPESEDNCLAEGTRIATPGGPRKIEDLRLGDDVLSWDHARGRVRTQTLVGVRNTLRQVGRLQLPSGATLRATAEHPFYDDATGRYVRIGEFQVSGSFVTLDDAWQAPGSLRAARVSELITASLPAPHYQSGDEQARVFDLTVAGDHNYFAEGVLVHNKSAPDGDYEELPCGFTAAHELTVCSGDVLVREGDDGTQVIVRKSVLGGGGAPGSDDAAQGGKGGEGGSSSTDVVVVGFDDCRESWKETWTIHVGPNQTVGLMEGAACDVEGRLQEITADAAGDLALPQNVRIVIQEPEFDCLFYGPRQLTCANALNGPVR